MDNYSPACYVAYGEPVCKNCRKRVPAVAEKRRQVAGVGGVGASARVIVAARAGEWVARAAGAVASLVYMEGINEILASGALTAIEDETDCIEGMSLQAHKLDDSPKHQNNLFRSSTERAAR